MCFFINGSSSCVERSLPFRKAVLSVSFHFVSLCFFIRLQKKAFLKSRQVLPGNSGKAIA